jgi:hypothetical protein
VNEYILGGRNGLRSEIKRQTSEVLINADPRPLTSGLCR